METLKSGALYAYFGELGIFDDNIPGHTFYQLGLLDEIARSYQIDGFDFFNYIDNGKPGDIRPIFPNDKIGKVFEKYCNELVFEYRIQFDKVLNRIKMRWYSKIFLKARFRNLSTLEKKLNDAARFEEIITVALAAGYDPADIVILDTDLSLSPDFLETSRRLGLCREIPSITMQGCSKRFLEDCLALHSEHTYSRQSHLTYYGNLSFDNYKTGHSKDPIIIDIINAIDEVQKFNGEKFTMTVAAKQTSLLEEWIAAKSQVRLCPRQNREEIWDSLLHSLVSVNVSKALYLAEGFTPARVYESLMLGVIPVSYKDPSLHPAMSFETVDEFFEICKFLSECSHEDYQKILNQIVSSLY